ncbi:MAG: hypothetical protein JWM32_2714 [Verrucomicrobia bacterium]|nr:hypothetical protein [Verrucomicrobiota bacterium]
MHDDFTGKNTRIKGSSILGAEERVALQYDHERRLEALARVGAAAGECGIETDSDRDLIVLEEDEVSLLEAAGPEWAAFGGAIRELRALLPIKRLEDFGFLADAENPLEEPNARLRRIGGGVEAWAYAAESDHSVYKFYLPREGQRIGSVFGFRPGEETLLQADARLGDYASLLQKLFLIEALGGMPTEVIAVTPEGILVAKQSLGEPLPQGDDMSQRLPEGLIEIPSRLLRANRDHPRLFLIKDHAWLVADLHARNFVRCSDGELRVIDLVAARWPDAETARNPLIAQWLEAVRRDPSASLLGKPADDEL